MCRKLGNEVLYHINCPSCIVPKQSEQAGYLHPGTSHAWTFHKAFGFAEEVTGATRQPTCTVVPRYQRLHALIAVLPTWPVDSANFVDVSVVSYPLLQEGGSAETGSKQEDR